VPSRGTEAVDRAVDWVEERQPDLTLVSGDLLSRRAGEDRLRELLARLPECYAVLGNHDLALSRDPFSEAVELWDLEPATLLRDESRVIELRGRSIQIVGVDPRSYRRGRSQPARLADPEADLRILLCHFPDVVNRLAEGAFHLVLAGHLHAGQICMPWPGGRLPLAHIRWTYVRGLYPIPGGALHVSAGLGTTFVPFRFLARPEATELVLESVT
jgi:predicted MPP superfamily phosphohydrolase